MKRELIFVHVEIYRNREGNGKCVRGKNNQIIEASLND